MWYEMSLGVCFGFCGRGYGEGGGFDWLIRVDDDEVWLLDSRAVFVR